MRYVAEVQYDEDEINTFVVEAPTEEDARELAMAYVSQQLNCGIEPFAGSDLDDEFFEDEQVITIDDTFGAFKSMAGFTSDTVSE